MTDMCLLKNTKYTLLLKHIS